MSAREKIKKEKIVHEIEEDVAIGMKKTKGFFKDFKDFAVKGNAVDLAVGVIIGAAFKDVVDSLVADIIMPPLSLLTGSIDFSNRYVVLDDKGIDYNSLQEAEEAGVILVKYGEFINVIISFLLVSLIIFIIVKKLINVSKKDEEKKAKKTKSCPYCFEEIKIEANRCPNCTSKLS